MRILGMLVLMLAAWGCQAQVYYKSATFKIENASQSTTYPGIQGAPIVTTIHFNLILKKCTRISFDSFWANGCADKVQISYKNGEAWDGKPLKGDTLLVRLVYFKSTAQVMVFPDGVAVLPEGSKQEEAPVKHKGEALFRYTMNGKSQYFSIEKVGKGNDIYAP